GSENCVDACLVASPSSLEPIQDVFVEPHGERNFWLRLQDFGPAEPLARGDRGRIRIGLRRFADIRVAQALQAFPIRFPRAGATCCHRRSPNSTLIQTVSPYER